MQGMSSEWTQGLAFLQKEKSPYIAGRDLEIGWDDLRAVLEEPTKYTRTIGRNYAIATEILAWRMSDPGGYGAEPAAPLPSFFSFRSHKLNPR
jgi:hypothetical protein